MSLDLSIIDNNYLKTLRVDGVQYQNVHEALNDINNNVYGTPDLYNRLAIFVDTGVFTEMNQNLDIPEFVSLLGNATNVSTILLMGSSKLTIHPNSVISNVTIASSASTLTMGQAVVNIDGTNSLVIDDYTPRIQLSKIISVDNNPNIIGIYTKPNNSSVYITSCDIYNFHVGVECGGGDLFMENSYITLFNNIVPERTSNTVGIKLTTGTEHTIHTSEVEDYAIGILLHNSSLESQTLRLSENTVNLSLNNNSTIVDTGTYFANSSFTVADIELLDVGSKGYFNAITYNPSKLTTIGKIYIAGGRYSDPQFGEQFRSDGSTPTWVTRDRDLALPDGVWAIKNDDDRLSFLKNTSITSSFSEFSQSLSIGRNGLVGQRDSSRNVEFFTDFLTTTELNWQSDLGTSSTFNVATNIESGRCGIRVASIGALVGARVNCFCSDTSTNYKTLSLGNGTAIIETSFTINQLNNSPGSEQWFLRSGFVSDRAILGTSYLAVATGYVSAGSLLAPNSATNFYFVSSNGSSTTLLDTGLVFTINRWYRMRLECNAAGTEAKLFWGFQTSGNTTLNSPTITGLATSNNLRKGMYVRAVSSNGVNLFPPNTYIISYTSNSLTLNNNALGTNTGAKLKIDNSSLRNFVGASQNGSSIITGVPTSVFTDGIDVGHYVTGTGIPQGSRILTVSPATNSITISNNATISQTSTLSYAGFMTLTTNIPTSFSNNTLYPSIGVTKVSIVSSTATFNFDYAYFYQEFSLPR